MITGQRSPIATCKSCYESIIWAVTEQGKRMPVDVEPVEGGNVVLSPGPRPVATVVSPGGREPGRKLHRPHFSTCRQAGQHGAKTPAPPRQKAPAMPQEGLFSEADGR